MINHYGRHYILLPNFVNHWWYIEFNAGRYITPMINTNKQTNKQAIGFKPGTSWYQVEYSTTASTGKEGMIHEFSLVLFI